VLSIRGIARRLLGVQRTPTYYLPWLTRPGLTCALLVNNMKTRLQAGATRGPYHATIVQYDAAGRVCGRYTARLAAVTDTAEVTLDAVPSGHGFVTVSDDDIDSDLYVTLSEGDVSSATHGRSEFLEHYPPRARAAHAVLGGALALLGRTLPAFIRDQFVYAGRESRSHLLLMNLADVPNRIRVVASRDGATLASRLIRLAPHGAHLLDVAALAGRPETTVCVRLRLEANAWFNLYLVGAGPRDLAGPLSLMHVK
jgi:hypothetical protein